jgi:hypothetical protein
MEAREVNARLAEIHRIGEETGKAHLALVAAVIVQAMRDAEHGVPGSTSDPEQARDWLRNSGQEWLEMLRLAAGGGGTGRARRVA